jgi:hypothetical protein
VGKVGTVLEDIGAFILGARFGLPATYRIPTITVLANVAGSSKIQVNVFACQSTSCRQNAANSWGFCMRGMQDKAIKGCCHLTEFDQYPFTLARTLTLFAATLILNSRNATSLPSIPMRWSVRI